MAKTKSPVDAYLAAQPTERRATLQQVRGTIQRALPSAEEIISYQIPAYRLHERVVLFFAGWSEHYSLYPITDFVRERLGNVLEGYAQSRGTVRFPLGKRVPVGLIAKIAKLRSQEELQRKRLRDGRESATQSAAKKIPAEKTPAKKAPAKKTPGRKAQGKKTPAKKARAR